MLVPQPSDLISSSESTEPGFWKYLFNPDKSATPQLESLCLGLAKIIVSMLNNDGALFRLLTVSPAYSGARARSSAHPIADGRILQSHRGKL